MAKLSGNGAIAPPYSYPTMGDYINPNAGSSMSGSSGSLGSFGSLVNPVASLAGGALGWIHEDISAAMQRKWAEEMWNKTNEYNTPKNQLARLEEAGLNPLYYGLDGSSANGVEMTQRSSVNGLQNPVQSSVDTALKLRMQEAQVENLEAQTQKMKSETEGTQISNDFARATFDARVQGEKLANALKRGQIELIDKEKSKMLEEIRNIAAQTETEFARATLYECESGLARAKAWQIAVLTPLEAELTKAKTEHEKSMASLAMVQALYQKDFVTSGYVQALVNEISERTEGQVTSNQLKELENDIKHGDSGRLAKWFNDNPSAKALMPALGFLSTDLWPLLNQISVTTSGILGPILGFAVGKGAAAKASNYRTKYTTLYGPDNNPMQSFTSVE